jgi:hypothetical protein
MLFHFIEEDAVGAFAMVGGGTPFYTAPFVLSHEE